MKSKRNGDRNYRKKGFNFQNFSLNLEHETKRDIAIIVFLVLTLICVLSVFHLAGILGDRLFGFLKIIFGMLAFLTPVIFGAIAYSLFKDRHQEEEYSSSFLRVYLGAVILCGGIAGLMHLFLLDAETAAFDLAFEGRGGGVFGAIFAAPLYAWLGMAGAIVLIALLFIGVMVMLNISFFNFFPKRKEEQNKPVTVNAPDSANIKISGMAAADFIQNDVNTKNAKLTDAAVRTEVKVPSANLVPPLKIDSIVLEDRKDWKLPPFDLLDDNKTTVDSGNIETNMAIIQKTLADFGIEAEMGEVNVGPTVTQYTLKPAVGVKLSQIAALQDNLALELAAKTLRMELPVPGKSLVGIEVPNRSPMLVSLKEVLQTAEFVESKSRLVFALGRDVSGKQMVGDLAKMPHLLVAGATGTGKSVAMNSLLISLLYRNTPQDVKLIVIDPKRVEMIPYNGIPHLLTPVVVDSDKAVNALKWSVNEMDRRYKLMSEAHKRNIVEYNEANELRLPYIVIVIDELADLMAAAKSEVEGSIVRLAQLARAVGIHLVLATQYPNSEIVTGLIKANITAKIACKVASNVNSRVILDTSGAEKLLGNGDMLFISAELTKPKRIQGSYVSGKEVKKVVEFFRQQAGAVIYNEEIVEKPKHSMNIPGFSGSADGMDTDDDLFEAAVEEVKNAGKASASLLQRRLRIGYARAARLLDILEAKGIIGPGDGAKPREVFGVIPKEEKAEYGIETNEE